jgi:hypothetical protein
VAQVYRGRRDHHSYHYELPEGSVSRRLKL